LLGHIPEFDRGIKRARFAVLRQTRVPAVLIEGGFLTERGESQLIAKTEWRAKLAAAISVGIENYQALAGKHQPPMLVADYRRQGPAKTVAPEESKPPLQPPWQRPQLSTPTSLESAAIVP
jgi:N-acetylmuramoyl-L-alanine amidase